MSTEVSYEVTAAESAIGDYQPLVDWPGGRFLVPRTVRVRVDIKGEQGLERFDANVRLIERRYLVERIEAQAPADPPGELSLEALRRVPLDRLLKEAIEPLVFVQRIDGERATTVRYPVLSRESEWIVAITYSLACAVGGNPTMAVADQLNISRGGAAQRVRRAREAGYLPPTTQGRTS